MLSFLLRAKFVPFNIPAIGDHWTRGPVNFAGRGGELQVRRLSSSLERNKYRFVALVEPDTPVSSSKYDLWTGVIQNSLEAEGKGLLVVAHFEPSQVTWYAYSSTRAALDETLYAQRESHPVRWGINEDKRWGEYEFSRNLAGA